MLDLSWLRGDSFPLLFLLTTLLAGCGAPESFLGTELSSADPAPEFQLRDQFDRPVALSDHRGKVVVLTFLYINCPDICPIVASHVKRAHGLLGDETDRVSFLAVSVDPERDTVEQAREYTERLDMASDLAFLVGSRDELEPIWKAYFVAADLDGQAGTGTQRQQPLGVQALRQGIPERYTITHSAPVYLIDRHGVMRSLFTLPIDPEELVHDIRLLLD